MDLEEKYKKETGFDVGKIHEIGTTYYSDDYVNWLEKAIDYIPCCKSDSEQLVCEKCNGTGGYSYVDKIGFNYKTCECQTN